MGSSTLNTSRCSSVHSMGGTAAMHSSSTWWREQMDDGVLRQVGRSFALVDCLSQAHSMSPSWPCTGANLMRTHRHNLEVVLNAPQARPGTGTTCAGLPL